MGGCRRPNSIRGSSSDQADSGACRSEGFILHEDVPDGFGESAPYKEVYAHFGLTPANLADSVRRLLHPVAEAERE